MFNSTFQSWCILMLHSCNASVRKEEEEQKALEAEEALKRSERKDSLAPLHAKQGILTLKQLNLPFVTSICFEFWFIPQCQHKIIWQSLEDYCWKTWLGWPLYLVRGDYSLHCKKTFPISDIPECLIDAMRNGPCLKYSPDVACSNLSMYSWLYCTPLV